MASSSSCDLNVSMIKASDEFKVMFCEQCDLYNEREIADGFCVECMEYMCATCLKYHKRQKPDHKQQDKNKMPQDFCFEQCNTHRNKIIKFYCSLCRKFACSECKLNEHAKCSDIGHVPTLAKGVENCDDLNRLSRNIVDINIKLDKTKQILDLKFSRSSSKQEKVKEDVKQQKERMEKHFLEQEQSVIGHYDRGIEETRMRLEAEKKEKLTQLNAKQRKLAGLQNKAFQQSLQKIESQTKTEKKKLSELVTQNKKIAKDTKQLSADLERTKSMGDRSKIFITMIEAKQKVNNLREKEECHRFQTNANERKDIESETLFTPKEIQQEWRGVGLVSPRERQIYIFNETENSEQGNELGLMGAHLQLVDILPDLPRVDKHDGQCFSRGGYGQHSLNEKGLILACVPTALSMVKDKVETRSKETSKVVLVMNLLLQEDHEGNASFLHGVCGLIAKLLKQKDSKTHVANIAHHWLINATADSENVYKAGSFRLIVVAEKQTVYDKFPTPLINGLEKHFLTYNTMVSPDQRQVVKMLEDWAKQFVAQRNVDCMHRFKLRGQKSSTNIGDVFISFHEDTCSAIVLHVWKKYANIENEKDRDTQVLEEAKFVLLWCATPESLVRLDNGALSNQEKKLLKRIYFETQAHDSLVQYLNFKIIKQECGQLFAQITTHSKLMTGGHKGEISNATGIHVDKIFLLEMLSSFGIEQQFSNNIQHQCTDQEPSLVVIQCNLGDVNESLIACTRYCVMRELEKMRDDLNVPVHVVFIVQLPRGAPFTGFQCGVWHSAHIADLCTEDMMMPTLQDTKGKSIAKLFTESDALRESTAMEIDEDISREK